MSIDVIRPNVIYQFTGEDLINAFRQMERDIRKETAEELFEAFQEKLDLSQKLLNIDEIAVWLDVHPATIRRWIKEGKETGTVKIPHRKLAGTLLFSKLDVLNHMERISE